VLIAPRIFKRFWNSNLSFFVCGFLVVIVVLLDKESWFYKAVAVDLRKIELPMRIILIKSCDTACWTLVKPRFFVEQTR